MVLRGELMRQIIFRMMLGFLFTVGLVTAAQPQNPAQPAAKKSETPRVYQVVISKLGPAWQKDKAPEMQPGIQDHAAYMGKLEKEGSLVLGGPLFVDSKMAARNGSMIILAADSPEAARKILADEPAHKTGLFVIEDIRPFVIMRSACPPGSMK
jgi:uncharacterized protein YciI